MSNAASNDAFNMFSDMVSNLNMANMDMNEFSKMQSNATEAFNEIAKKFQNGSQAIVSRTSEMAQKAVSDVMNLMSITDQEENQNARNKMVENGVNNAREMMEMSYKLNSEMMDSFMDMMLNHTKQNKKKKAANNK